MNARRIVMQVSPCTLVFALSLAPFGIALGEWPVPEELEERLTALSEAQADFISSGAALEFVPEQQLRHELAARDDADLKVFVNELMSVAMEMGYDATRDMGATPLNTASKRFNRGTLPTPAALRELQREPGPFSVHRYLFPQSGVPTFAGARVAIWPEDLVAGSVDVAIIGVPNNASSGRRDAGNGPDAMRAMNTIAAPDSRSLVRPHEILSIVDYGNFSVDWLTTELTVGHVTNMVTETALTGAIPMLVGGDTSMLYPGVRGIAEALGDRPFGLLQLNAHPDAERFGDHTISDRQSMFLLLDEGIVDGRHTVQVGLRGPDVDAATLQWLRDKSVRYHTMTEIRQKGFDNVLKRVLREVEKGPDRFFVSIDVSVIDPGDLVASGRTVADGLDIEEAVRAIRHVCAAKDIVGFEITDLAPMLDVSRLSVINSNALLNACLVGIAVRKAGLDPDYIHPLAIDHGQR